MKYIFGNWKMFLDYDESIALANEVKSLSYAPEKLQLTVFPNYLALHDIVQILKDTKIGVGAQTVSRRPQGAYTGAISAYLVKKIGCTHGLVGHSERRYIFHESDEDIHDKIEASFKVGLSPVLCVGETEEDLKEGKRQYRLKKQLMKALEGIEFTPSVPFFVAYEPVWAVSSGKPCNPADADDVHGWIKEELKQYTDMIVPVLYGGSVDQENVVSYLSRETIDGVLVGSASTKRDSFAQIIARANEI